MFNLLLLILINFYSQETLSGGIGVEKDLEMIYDLINSSSLINANSSNIDINEAARIKNKLTSTIQESINLNDINRRATFFIVDRDKMLENYKNSKSVKSDSIDFNIGIRAFGRFRSYETNSIVSGNDIPSGRARMWESGSGSKYDTVHFITIPSNSSEQDNNLENIDKILDMYTNNESNTYYENNSSKIILENLFRINPSDYPLDRLNQELLKIFKTHPKKLKSTIYGPYCKEIDLNFQGLKDMATNLDKIKVIPVWKASPIVPFIPLIMHSIKKYEWLSESGQIICYGDNCLNIYNQDKVNDYYFLLYAGDGTSDLGGFWYKVAGSDRDDLIGLFKLNNTLIEYNNNIIYIQIDPITNNIDFFVILEIF